MKIQDGIPIHIVPSAAEHQEFQSSEATCWSGYAAEDSWEIPSNLRYLCLIHKQNTEHNSKKLYTPGIDLIRPSRKNIAKHAKTIKDLNGPQPSSSTHHIE